MKPLSFRNIYLASAIALPLLATAGMAQTTAPRVKVQRPVRVLTQPPVQPAATPILVLPSSALRQARAKPPMPIVNTNLKLLTDAEKLAMVTQVPGHTATLPTGILSSAVLTPMQPYLQNQASILEGSGFSGLRVNGESASYYPPHWFVGGLGDTITAQFLPFHTGQLTFVVFHVVHLNKYRGFTINGNNTIAFDSKVVFAVTPESSDPSWIHLKNTHADQMTLVTSVEIFVMK